jgi:hypothetical protein
MMRIQRDGLYTTTDLMEILDCGRRTVLDHIKYDSLPIIRLSRQRIFVQGSDLISWLRERMS